MHGLTLLLYLQNNWWRCQLPKNIIHNVILISLYTSSCRLHQNACIWVCPCVCDKFHVCPRMFLSLVSTYWGLNVSAHWCQAAVCQSHAPAVPPAIFPFRFLPGSIGPMIYSHYIKTNTLERHGHHMTHFSSTSTDVLSTDKNIWPVR